MSGELDIVKRRMSFSRSREQKDNDQPIQLKSQNYYIIIQIEGENLKAQIDINVENNSIYMDKLLDKIMYNNLKLKGKVIITTKIATQNINVDYEVSLSDKIILGIEFLNKVKPWKIESDYFEYTYNQIQFKTRIINE